MLDAELGPRSDTWRLRPARLDVKLKFRLIIGTWGL